MPKLPWILGNTVRRPTFHFPRIKLGFPTEIPMSAVYGAVMLIIFYVFVGGAYDLVQKPEALGGMQSPEIVVKSLDQQYLLEGLIAGTVMFLGAAGLYTLHYATSFSTDLRRSSSVMAVGVLMVLAALVMILALWNSKIARA